MHVDTESAEKIVINLEISMHHISCDLLTFDAQDAMGNRDVGAKGNLWKVAVRHESCESESLSEHNLKGDQTTHPVCDHGLQNGASPCLDGHRWVEISRSEATDWMGSMGRGGLRFPSGHFSFSGGPTDSAESSCVISGSVLVNRAPGHLHIGTTGVWRDRNRSADHVVNHFSFGEDRARKFSDTPLDGWKSIVPMTASPTPSSSSFTGLLQPPPTSFIFEYFLKIVPTTFTGLTSAANSLYQFSVTKSATSTGFMPGIYFRYDFSPLRVKYVEWKENFGWFLVRVLAIIGGLFSVVGLLHAVLMDSVEILQKRKQGIGKLG